jgi:D-tagatose-1,6-bisphosphate aldolase subunit GatZ/KbaZ
MKPSAASARALDEVVRAQKRGRASGITGVCSAHPSVLEAALRHALATGETLLVESTCNQVNQYGGYTGLRSADFSGYLDRLARRVGFPRDRLILGGDHLGPSAWQQEPASSAMEKARTLVRDAVLAGYAKIHLDSSMRCADDPRDRRLDPQVSAARSAELARAAEEAFAGPGGGRTPPRYVIGTDVPPPGGIRETDEEIRVTSPAEVEETIRVTRRAFLELGLDSAWERVIAVVVQPGVEYGDQAVCDYSRAGAAALSRFIEGVEGLVYEAHSTDYQTSHALRHLVEDHFAILKVGPALTFAFREAVFALAMIEEEWLGGRRDATLSHLRAALDKAMVDNPRHWDGYHTAAAADRAVARRYSLSDRSRYYWPAPTVQAALERLMDNLRVAPIPLPLLSQFMPAQYRRVREGALAPDPHGLVIAHITQTLTDYTRACMNGTGDTV